MVFLLPFINFPDLFPVYFQLQLSDILFVLAGLVFSIYVVTGKKTVRRSWFYFPLIAYFFALLLSTLFSENPALSWKKLVANSYLPGLAFMAFNLTDSFEKFKKVAQAWMSGMFIVGAVSLVSLLLYYFDNDNPILQRTLFTWGSLPPGTYPRIQSTFNNPNMLSNYLIIGPVLVWFAYVFEWFSRTGLLVFSILLAVATIFTLSPGIGGSLLVTGLLLWIHNKKKNPLLSKSGLIGGILAAILFFISVLPSPTNFPEVIEPSGRIISWIASIKTFWEYPVTGIGLGVDPILVSYSAPYGIHYITDPHQLFLNVAAQLGTIGIFALSLLLFYLLSVFLPKKKLKPGEAF